MENTKKQGFCIGIPFLILQAICFLGVYWFDCIKLRNLARSAINLPLAIVMVAIIVFLFLKKENIVLAGLSGLLALLYLVSGFSSGNILWACAWILVALIILSKNEIVSALKEKTSLLKKIFYCVAIISTAVGIFKKASFFSIHCLFSLLHVYLSFDLLFAFNALLNLSYGIGLILIGKWLLPAHKKKEKASTNNSSEAIDCSEFYVSMGKHICLMLFTFGIWQMIWVHKVTKFCNAAKGEDQKNPTTSLLLYLFIPFYSIYWTYKMAQRIDKIAKEKGIDSDLGAICLILAIFIGFVPPILMQDKINGVLTSNGKTTESFDNGIEHLEKYKDLLDKGIITQEEFDAKKKQLLDL